MTMKTRTVETYTLDELKDAHPETYVKLHEKWRELVANDDAPWGDETMDSLKATVKACGALLHNWSIGAYAPCSMTVGVQDDFIDGNDEESAEIRKDEGWFFDHVLKGLGYTRDSQGKVEFPGLCPFTGYCADDAFLEHVYKQLQRGNTLTDALESLADVAGKMVEDDLEQMQEEDSMLANWGENQYDKDGREY